MADELEVTVRRLARSDCESLAACTRAVYGDTYIDESFYRPDDLWSRVESGSLCSIVAVDSADRVIGHMGLSFSEPDRRVGDMGNTFTDPAFRHHHVLEHLGMAMALEVADLGVVGYYAEPVAVHTATQRADAREDEPEGRTETGILLAYVPATVEFGVGDDLDGQRASCVLAYSALRPTPPRVVTLPDRYAEELRRVYRDVALERIERPASPAEGRSELSVHPDDRWSLGRIVVRRAGADLVPAVERHVRSLGDRGLGVIHVELPLADAGAACAVEGLREIGFFYAGLIPELRDGDILRLQLLEVEVDPARLRLYGENAKRLLAFVVGDRVT